MKAARPLAVIFFKTEATNEPVREWLRALSQDARKTIGEDILTVQYAWPVGKPLVDHLGEGIWEIRSRLKDAIARTLFTVVDQWTRKSSCCMALLRNHRNHQKGNSTWPGREEESIWNHENKNTQRKRLSRLSSQGRNSGRSRSPRTQAGYCLATRIIAQGPIDQQIRLGRPYANQPSSRRPAIGCVQPIRHAFHPRESRPGPQSKTQGRACRSVGPINISAKIPACPSNPFLLQFLSQPETPWARV
jgi:hypothetical protein